MLSSTGTEAVRIQDSVSIKQTTYINFMKLDSVTNIFTDVKISSPQLVVSASASPNRNITALFSPKREQGRLLTVRQINFHFIQICCRTWIRTKITGTRNQRPTVRRSGNKPALRTTNSSKIFLNQEPVPFTCHRQAIRQSITSSPLKPSYNTNSKNSFQRSFVIPA